LTAGALIGLLAALVTALLQAPASWLDWGLSQATQGRVRLAQAEGTVWHGKARIMVADIRDARMALSELGGRTDRAPDRRLTLAGLPIPGDFIWDLQPGALLAGRIDLDLRHSSQSQSSRVSVSLAGIEISKGTMTLPTVALEQLGSPWNSLRPTANVSLSWDHWRIDLQGRGQGRLVIELSDVGSAMTPVRPLGTFRGELVSSGEQAQVNLTTLAGPLRLEGSGRWTVRSGLRLEARAWSDPEASDRLQPLLSLMGRREGDKTIIRLGA
jgi:general secretion pathway protein N